MATALAVPRAAARGVSFLPVGAHRRPLGARTTGARSPTATRSPRSPTRATVIAHLPEVRPTVVRRGAADLGEAQGRARGEGRRPDDEASEADAALDVATQGAPRAGRAIRCRRARRDVAGRRAALRAAAAELGLDSRASRRRGADAARGARVLRRARAPICELWGMSRDLVRRARCNPPEPRSRSARRPADRRASSCGSPTTARCSSAAPIVMAGYRGQPEKTARGDRRATAGCTPATSPRSTTTAT